MRAVQDGYTIPVQLLTPRHQGGYLQWGSLHLLKGGNVCDLHNGLCTQVITNKTQGPKGSDLRSLDPPPREPPGNANGVLPALTKASTGLFCQGVCLGELARAGCSVGPFRGAQLSSWYVGLCASSSGVTRQLCLPQVPPPATVYMLVYLLLHCLGIANVGVHSYNMIVLGCLRQ